MSVEIRVPILGESVVSATVTRWLKQPGETVARDEPIVELETDKISIEVPAPCGGVLTAVSVASGEDVQVGAILGALEAQDSLRLSPDASEGKTHPAATPPNDDATTRSAGATSADPSAHASIAAPPPLPAAAQLMQARNLTPDDITSTSGKGGRITKADVLNHLESQKPKTAPAPTPQASSAAHVSKPDTSPAPRMVASKADDAHVREERMPMSRLRQTIARRLKDAQNTAAILTTFNEIDMSVARNLRDTYRATFEKKHGVRLGYMSFFARAVIEALQSYPALNAEIIGNDIAYRHYVNLGIAVGSSRGLVVPVIRDADQMGFAELERKISDYGKRARDGALKLEELANGTFSITNGGVFGSLLSTPILNTPQSGILGMHAIQDRPVAVDGQVVIRPMMYVALSYDHRIVDGREAVGFLVRVKQLVEDPHCLLLDI